jgi:hypothetical protein
MLTTTPPQLSSWKVRAVCWNVPSPAFNPQQIYNGLQ